MVPSDQPGRYWTQVTGSIPAEPIPAAIAIVHIDRHHPVEGLSGSAAGCPPQRSCPWVPTEELPEPPDHVYFIQAGIDGPIKVGMSRDPARRLITLQGANPAELTLLAVVEGNRDDERAIHERFSDCRIRGEWFEPTPELLAFIAGLAR
jgi:hypothetical protein